MLDVFDPKLMMDDGSLIELDGMMRLWMKLRFLQVCSPM